ncbi:hypothetical protein BZA77DRAFT_314941 [Pyronema omphalodes]|nr:hypothetical protein BZA77DRAFT_314941 [Pyronema omphalodes]
MVIFPFPFLCFPFLSFTYGGYGRSLGVFSSLGRSRRLWWFIAQVCKHRSTQARKFLSSKFKRGVPYIPWRHARPG